MPSAIFFLITWIEVDGWNNRRKHTAIVVDTDMMDALEKLRSETDYPLRKEFTVLSAEIIEADRLIR